MSRFDNLEIEELIAQDNARRHPAHREETLDEITALVELQLGEPKVEATAVTSESSSDAGAVA